MDIKITKATELKTKPTLEEEASLGFGKRFTDHMFMMNYDNGDGMMHASFPIRDFLSILPAPFFTMHRRFSKALRHIVPTTAES